ncbi:MAG: class II D-tagatose-bisphosphate aldolase, non-catalytic subunit [Firmicutes bacterium]|nr:class II D-tagatose-bisphosphate aldolase, non-catalytic subunit [Bacillota bacterium]
MHPIKEMIMNRDKGGTLAIPSYCTGSVPVIRAALKRAARTGKPLLIEATANQVDQKGGYTGLKPRDFYEMVYEMADEEGLDRDLLILGGDHLGPLTWANLPEKEAMANAEVLVREYVKAGFTKIHLDTSMKLTDDPEGAFPPEIPARRGAFLYKVAMAAYEERLKEVPDAQRPVFVIGSEVPVPGGAQEEEEGLTVTSPAAFNETMEAYVKYFTEQGMPDALDDVIACVVQPGVEFGDEQVFQYDSEKAADLMAALKDHPGIVFEGHSTDYQSRESLRAMTRDGVGILKVGPALTFALREGLFALNMMEEELIPALDQSLFDDILEQIMTAEPGKWQNHYHGSPEALKLKRRYSFSDRSRYYMGHPEVQASIGKLFGNLRKVDIPLSMLHQYMPMQYEAVRDGLLPKDPEALIADFVEKVMEDYEYACEAE